MAAKKSPPSAKLLPAGIYDLLPPEAENKRKVTNRILEKFAKFGFEQVDPPLIEFEDTLLGDANSSMGKRAFRALDPSSQKIMALRPDITLQTARIARTRFSSLQKPIRLSYAGDVLWVKGSSIRGERQHTQVGIELIGEKNTQGDAEVLQVMIHALSEIGIDKYTIDLNLPRFASLIIDDENVGDEESKKILGALSNKDSGFIEHLANSKLKKKLLKLIDSVGNPEKALKILSAIDLPSIAEKELAIVKQVTAALKNYSGKINFILDVTETRGFEYHTGLSFSVLVTGYPEEIGRGGRYELNSLSGGDEKTTATGLTLYVNHIMRIIGESEKKNKRVIVPFGLDEAELAKLHDEGFITIFAGGSTSPDEAKKLNCKYIFKNGKAEKI